MHDAVEDAHHGQALPRRLPRRRRDEGEQGDGQEEARQHASVGVPHHRLPRAHAPDPSVDRHHVAGEDVDEGAEPAGPAEPRRHRGRRKEPGADHDRGRAPRGEAQRPIAGRDHGAEQPEERGVRLDRHRDPEREPAPQERAPRALLRPAGHTPRAQQEEEAEEEIALARVPRPAAQVVEREEEARRERPPAVADAPAVHYQDPAREGEPAQVEEPPREVVRAAHPQHREVQQVHPGQVHVEGVAVRHRPLPDQPGDVVHERRVVDERPAARGPREVREQQGASGRNKPQ